MSTFSDSSNVPDFPRFSLRFVFIAVAVFSLMVWLFAFLRNQAIERKAMIEKRTQTILATLDATVEELESIRAKLGRAPADERELEQLLGHPMPMPAYHLHYQQTAPNSFYLVFPTAWLEGFSGDYLIYESDKPTAGWVVRYD